jgi:thiosulfate reductase cytochrome b subunit
MVRLEMKAKHPLTIRWCHWINFPILALMLWSGMWIYWANDVYFAGWGDHKLFSFFPSGFYDALGLGHNLAGGLAWHFFFGWFFTINGIVYVLYTLLSGEWRYLVPGRSTLKEAVLVTLHDLHIYKGPLPVRKFNGAQQIAYTSVILMGLGSLITGFAIYKPAQLAWLTSLCGGYRAARVEHFLLTLGYVGFFLIHVTQVILAGWNNFRSMVSGYELISEELPEEEAHE